MLNLNCFSRSSTLSCFQGEVGDLKNHLPGQVDFTNSTIRSNKSDSISKEVKKETPMDLVKPEKEKVTQNLNPRVVIDNRVSTIKTLVKEEPKDCPKPWNAISVVMPPASIKQEPAIKPEMNEDKKEMLFENLARTIKSDQQAKIPLKKRELKRSGGYDVTNHYSNINHNNNNLNSNGSISTGGIIVRNPAVLPLKEEQIKGQIPSDGDKGPVGIITVPLEPIGKLDINQYIGVGVIKGPIERKRPLDENDNSSNGHHGNGNVLTKAVGKDSVRQSVLVGNSMVKEDNGPLTCSIPEDLSKDGCNKRLDVSAKVVEESTTTEEMEPTSVEETIEKRDKKEAVELKNSKTVGEETDVVVEDESKIKGPKGTRKRKSQKTKSKLQVREDSQKMKLSSNIGEVLEKNTGEGAKNGRNNDEEVSSELQKEGIRLKIKIPLHRRTPELQHKDIEELETGNRRSLRRSARISKPSPKVADGRDGKQDRKLSAAQDEDEHVEDEKAKVLSKKMDTPKPLKVP